MLRSAPRRPIGTMLVMCLVGATLAAVPAGAHHDIGEDPAAYGEPHAGWTAPPRAPGRLAPATGSLLGVHPEDAMGGPIDEENQKIITTERTMGRTLDINNTYYSDFHEIANEGLSAIHAWDIEMGRIPLIGWACDGTTSAKVASGAEDETIRKTAEAFKAFGHEFFMRYCWEMDGSKRMKEVGTPEEFIKAWIHIYEVFKAEGVTNVVWVWCGNANTYKYTNDRGKWAWDYYPGDQYVDWVSADGYNWGAAKRGGDRWRGMVEIFDEFMVWARSTGAPATTIVNENFPPGGFPNKREVKPIMIGEYGAIEDKGDHRRKAEWMTEAHDVFNGNKPRSAECPNCGIYSDVAALVYFDINADAAHQNGDWRIISSDESTAAYKKAAADDPWFDQIHTLGWAPAANRADGPPPGQTPTTPPPPGPDPNPTGPAPAQERSGYWMLGADGAVYPFGDAAGHGDSTAAMKASPAVGVVAVDLEPTPSGKGYWLLDSTGTVRTYGDAVSFGATPRLGTGETATSLSSVPNGAGYWIFTNRGRVLPFGSAVSHGDMAEVKLNAPVLDSVATPSGKGYYMVAGDGGIFSFGDAAFWGSMGGSKLNAPVQSLVPDADGAGYWLVATDGGLFAFASPFRGSMGGTRLNKPVTGMVPFGNGYLMVAEDGGVFNFSDQPFAGSLGDKAPRHPIVAVAAIT